MVAILTTTSTKCVNATTDEFNWVQWYENMGMGTVMSAVANGEMTAEEACLKIIIPASEAGKVEQSHVAYFIERYPETKGLLEVYGVITGTTPTVTPEPTEAPVEETAPVWVYVVGGVMGFAFVIGFGAWLIKKGNKKE